MGFISAFDFPFPVFLSCVSGSLARLATFSDVVVVLLVSAVV